MKLSVPNLENSYLIEVQNLTFSQIKLACNWELAFYKGHYDKENVKWIVYDQDNQEYIQQLKQDKNSDPQIPVDCSR